MKRGEIDMPVTRESLIRKVLSAHGKLSGDISSFGRSDDLYEAGMTSHASVNVMLGLEDTFGIEFPDSMLNRQMFSSIEAIDTALAKLNVGSLKAD